MAVKSTRMNAAKKAAAKKSTAGKAPKAATKKVVKPATRPATKKAAKSATVPSSRKTAKHAARPVAKPAARAARNTKAKTAAASANAIAAQRIDELIARTADWRGERLAELRTLIHDVDPHVIEEWKWMGTPVWSHDGMFVLANPHKGKVKLQFFHGAQLPDPHNLFNNGLEGGKWRAIDFHEGDTIDRVALRALLRAAIDYNATHAVAKSKGSRFR